MQPDVLDNHLSLSGEMPDMLSEEILTSLLDLGKHFMQTSYTVAQWVQNSYIISSFLDT